MCFVGYYRNKTPKDSESKSNSDIFNMIATALMFNVSYEDLGHMNLVMLSNIVDALAEEKQETDEERQRRLDAIT